MAVEHRYGLDHLMDLAAEKDGGFDSAVLAEMTGNFGRLRRDEFAVDDRRYEQLIHWSRSGGNGLSAENDPGLNIRGVTWESNAEVATPGISGPWIPP